MNTKPIGQDKNTSGLVEGSPPIHPDFKPFFNKKKGGPYVFQARLLSGTINDPRE
ncbi:hypothetical protein BY996DRAFT_6544081 [Phakopsora pachyrhizi]|nr:hypothetical protein BY996DRAFT_6544081 [Phakopsora pachyrhizi]